MKNIVVLVSGGGTNLQALIDAQESEPQSMAFLPGLSQERIILISYPTARQCWMRSLKKKPILWFMQAS